MAATFLEGSRGGHRGSRSLPTPSASSSSGAGGTQHRWKGGADRLAPSAFAGDGFPGGDVSSAWWACSHLAPTLLPSKAGMGQLRDRKDQRRSLSKHADNFWAYDLQDEGPLADLKPDLMSPAQSRPATSCSLSRPVSRSSAVGDAERQNAMAPATRRENLIQEQYEQQLDLAEFKAEFGPPGPDKKRGLDPLSHNEVAEVLGLIRPEDFVQETTNLDHRIEDMSRHVRLDHLIDSKTSEDKERKVREEMKRQREADLRKFRKREQEARTPQRKVALKLENKRRFQTTPADDQQIPMTTVEVQPKSNVAVVDVRMLRAKCKMLDEGGGCHSVEEILEWEKRKEKEDIIRSLRPSPNTSISAPELSTECSVDEKLERAKERHLKIRSQTILRKLANCRVQLPYMLPFSYTTKKEAQPAADPFPFSGPPGSPVSRSPSMIRKTSFGLSSDSPGSPASKDGSRRPSAVRGMRRGMTLLDRSSQLDRSQSQAVLKAIAKQARIRKRWAVAKSAVQVLVLFAQVLRRHRAIELVKSILTQLGEWARVRRSIKRLMSSIKVLQSTCRRYMEYKRRRCEQMQREWIKCEDAVISHYFRTYTQGMIKEMKEHAKAVADEPPPSKAHKRVRNRQKEVAQADAAARGNFISMMEAGVDSGNLQIDWRVYRIPPKDRWAMINAYYVKRLKKHVRTQGSFLATVKARLDSEREMVHFLKSFGADEVAVKDFKRSMYKVDEEDQPAKPLPFWHLTDEMILQLIALVAQSYADQQPFNDHPANRDVTPLGFDVRPETSSGSEAAQPLSAMAIASYRSMMLMRYMESKNWTVPVGQMKLRPAVKKILRPGTPPGGRPKSLLPGQKVTIEDMLQGFKPAGWDAFDGQASRHNSKSVPHRKSDRHPRIRTDSKEPPARRLGTKESSVSSTLTYG